MIENKHLRSFLRVLDLGSFSKAARSLNIAQPALSQHVRKLEDALGTVLLERSAHGVRPTAAGRDFSASAREILSLVETAERRFKSGADQLFGEVRLGLPGSVCPVLAPPLITAAASRFPNVRLVISEFMSGDLAVMLREGRMDVAMLFNVSESDDYTSEPLVTEALHLIGAPDAPLVRDDRVPARKLVDVPLVGTLLPHGLRLLVERWSTSSGIALTFAYEADAPTVLVRLASSGVCYSLVSKAAIDREITAGQLASAEVVDPPIERTACICSSKRMPPDAARDEIVRLVRETALSLVSEKQWPGGRMVQSA